MSKTNVKIKIKKKAIKTVKINTKMSKYKKLNCQNNHKIKNKKQLSNKQKNFERFVFNLTTIKDLRLSLERNLFAEYKSKRIEHDLCRFLL